MNQGNLARILLTFAALGGQTKSKTLALRFRERGIMKQTFTLSQITMRH